MSFDIITQNDGLRTVANIPIATVGEEWQTMTGPLTVTQEDLESAVNALTDPSIKLPRIKLGHLDPRFTPDGDNGIFDGTPVLGKFDNLRLSPDHQTLYADAIGVPEWFATIMPYAYPNRSMEGYWGVTTQTGHTHKFVITAVSLLGDEYPAIETLDDLQTMFSAEGPEWAEALTTESKLVAASKGGTMPQRRIAASTSVEDIRRAMFEDFFTEESGRYWWWIRAVYADPQVIICADETDELYAVSYDISGNEVSFGDPVNVFTQYVEVEGGKVAASTVMAKPAVATFSKAGGSRPRETQQRRVNEMPRTIHASVDVPALRSRLGLTAEQLPDDASDEQINEALANVTASPDPNVSDNPSENVPEPGTPAAGAPAPGEPTEGGADRGATGPTENPDVSASAPVNVDPEAWRQMQEDARLGREARQEQITARRARVVDEAIRAGRIPPARRAHYSRLMEVDEEGTTQLLASLEAGVVPVDELGSGNTDEVQDSSSYPEEWLTDEERRRVAAARSGQPLNTRVVSEAS